MFNKEDCSFETYRDILKKIKETGKFCDYADVLRDHRNQFLILRHDIEFSIARAYELAKIELEEGVSSSYFVQITNNAYNAFSEKNKRMLNDMEQMGHHIGLHYHRGSKSTLDDLKCDILFQARVLSSMAGVSVDRFSFHRPLREHLEANIEIDGLINAYAREFFVLTDDLTEQLDVKYIADSNHQWKYGLPTEAYFSNYDKIQLLVHPLSWSRNGANHVDNFRMLVKEKHDEFVETIEGEWKCFDKLRGKI